MTTVFIEARPKGRREGTAIVDYVVEEQGDRVLKAYLNDKKIPDHWRPV